MEYIKPPVNATWDSMEKNVTVSKYNNDKTPRTKQFRIVIIKKTGGWRSFLDYISPPLALYCIKIRENVQIWNPKCLDTLLYETFLARMSFFKNLRQICWLISGHPASSSFYHQFLGIVTLSKNKYTGVWSIKRLHSWNKENNQKPT